MAPLPKPIILAVSSCFVLVQSASAIKCSYNTSSVTTGSGGYGSGNTDGSTADCGKNSKYCISGNATSYVTTNDQTQGKRTTKVSAWFHACDTQMDLVGPDVLQGYKGIKCEVS